MNANENHRQEPLTAEEMAVMGLSQVAYLRPLPAREDEVEPHFALHAADGTRLAVIQGYEDAVATALHNDLQLVSLH